VTELASFSMSDLIFRENVSAILKLDSSHKRKWTSRKRDSPIQYFENPFWKPTKAVVKSQKSELHKDVVELEIELPNFQSGAGKLEEDEVACKGDKGARLGLQKRWHTARRRGKEILIKEICRQLLEGIAFMHSRDIVHRDLKPANILFVENSKGSWRVKLADFGLARFRLPGDFNEMTTLIGSPRYTSPELLKGQKYYENAVDMYSFGMVLWALVHEREPMGEVGLYQIIDEVVNRAERPKVSDECSPFWAALIEECWATNPRSRPQAKDILRRSSFIGQT